MILQIVLLSIIFLGLLFFGYLFAFHTVRTIAKFNKLANIEEGSNQHKLITSKENIIDVKIGGYVSIFMALLILIIIVSVVLNQYKI